MTRPRMDRNRGATKRLLNGELVGNPDLHHSAMAWLVSQRQGQRPLGYTLSLINATSPYTYWSNWCILWDKPYRRRFSTNPDDYTWETVADNLRHNVQDNLDYLEKGLLDIEDGLGPQWMRRVYIGPLETVDLATFLTRGQSSLKKQLYEELLYWQRHLAGGLLASAPAGDDMFDGPEGG